MSGNGQHAAAVGNLPATTPAMQPMQWADVLGRAANGEDGQHNGGRAEVSGVGRAAGAGGGKRGGRQGGGAGLPGAAEEIGSGGEEEEEEDEEEGEQRKPGRRKISIQFIADKNKRHITFSKRKAGVIKKVRLCLYPIDCHLLVAWLHEMPCHYKCACLCKCACNGTAIATRKVKAMPCAASMPLLYIHIHSGSGRMMVVVLSISSFSNITLGCRRKSSRA